MITKTKILLEACVDSVESAVSAQEGGAGRVELCSALSEGGITPSYGLIKRALEILNIPVNVLIRPRGGDFLYSADEFDVMKKDVQVCKSLGVSGVVFGILKPDGTVDSERSKELLNISRPMSVTFHRAFDMTREPFEAMEAIIKLGADRILTSGCASTAIDGIDIIRQLVIRANDKTIILPGGGVNENNILKIVSESGVSEIHASAKEKSVSKMTFKNNFVKINGNSNIDEYDLYRTSKSKIESLVKLLNNSTPE